MVRLELKGKKFQIFESATDREIEWFFEVLLKIDSLITKEHTTRKSTENLTSLQAFLSHCCVFHNYQKVW